MPLLSSFDKPVPDAEYGAQYKAWYLLDRLMKGIVARSLTIVQSFVFSALEGISDKILEAGSVRRRRSAKLEAEFDLSIYCTIFAGREY